MTDMKPDWFYNQSGVLPFTRKNDEMKILLVLSRSRKRWVIPKGIIEPGMTPQESAVKEAYEEAGIEGKIFTGEIGNYRYRKWGGECRVAVFPFEVETIHDSWPESHIRERAWLTPGEARRTVRETGLKQLIDRLGAYLETHPGA